MRAAAFLSCLLVSALLVSGCAQDTSLGPRAAVGDDAPAPLAFLAEVPLPQVQGAGEPNIAVTPDGTLFVTAPVGGSLKPNLREGKAYLWRSQDGGVSWDVLRSPDVVPAENAPDPGGVCSCDADVVASPDGWVYYSDWWAASVGNYLVEASPDNGETWTAVTVTAQQDLLASIDRQWLVAGEDGLLALYYSFYEPSPAGTLPMPIFGLDRPGQALHALFSTDHGATWSDPVAIVPASDRGYQIGHPRLAPDGGLWMPYGSVADGETYWRDPSQVRVVVNDRQGSVQADVLVADVPEGFDNLWAVQGATDVSTGRSFVVWAARTGDEHSGVFIAWSDDLVGWSAPYAVRADSVDFLPWADAADGKLTIGWYGGEPGTQGEPTEAQPDETWFAWAAQWDTAHGEASADSVVPVKVSPEPVKQGPLCPRGAACGGERELLDYVSLVQAPSGRVHYAFARSAGGAAFVQVATQDMTDVDLGHVHAAA